MVRKPFAKKEEPKNGKKRLTPHSTYTNKEGVVIPSVTGVLSMLGKPFLITWANRMGLKGINSDDYRDEMGVIGGLAHGMISSSFKDEEIELADFALEQVVKAKNCYKSYLKWREDKLLAPYLIENKLVSEEFQFGGTPDYYGLIDGVETILDYKTGAIYKEAYLQTCAYWKLLIENGQPAPQKIILLGIPRTDDEKFQEVIYTDFETGWNTFKTMLALHNQLKEIDKEFKVRSKK